MAGYLDGLGISDVYCSPILAARAGSMHGYDISDHGRLKPELGDNEELRALSATLRARAARERSVAIQRSPLAARPASSQSR